MGENHRRAIAHGRCPVQALRGDAQRVDVTVPTHRGPERGCNASAEPLVAFRVALNTKLLSSAKLRVACS